MILFGKNPVIETLKAKRRKIHEVYVSSKQNEFLDELKSFRIPCKSVDKEYLDQITENALHQGVAIKVENFPYSSMEEIISGNSVLIAAFDSIQDPQNFGNMARSAYCFGINGILIPKDRSVDVTPTVVKASAGAIEHMKIVRVTNLARSLDDLKKHEFWIYGASMDSTQTLKNVSPALKSVIVLGNEGQGIRPLVLKKCDVTFSIPLKSEFDSLNVTNAASIAFYEFSSKPTQ